jgi:transcription initiation factor IIE alpha subunit
VNREQWRSRHQILDRLVSQVGLTDQMLAEETGLTVTELRPVLMALYRQGLIDFCAGYVVLTVAPARQDAKVA